MPKPWPLALPALHCIWGFWQCLCLLVEQACFLTATCPMEERTGVPVASGTRSTWVPACVPASPLPENRERPPQLSALGLGAQGPREGLEGPSPGFLGAESGPGQGPRAPEVMCLQRDGALSTSPGMGLFALRSHRGALCTGEHDGHN